MKVKKGFLFLKFFVLIYLVLINLNSHAGPWLFSNDPYQNTDNTALKSDIDLLADFGFIKAPVLVWPIAWVNIGPVLLCEEAEVRLKKFPWFVQAAYFRILNKYQNAMQENFKPKAYIAGGSKINPFRTFQWQPRSDFEAGIAVEKQNYLAAGNIALNYGKYDDVTKDVHFDNSYLYLFLGNWGIGVDKVNRWWGPAYSDNMILSANAPPMPAITIQRMQSLPFESKWLSWIGPWSLTTSLSVGGPDAPIAHPLIWLSNVSFRPLHSLQFDISRVAYFAGDTRPVNGTMLWNLAIVNDNCHPDRDGARYCDKYSPGTEHWDISVDWNLQKLFHIPANLYLQTIFNDRVPHSSAPWLYLGFRPPVPGRTAFLAGANTKFPVCNSLVRLFAEFEYTFEYVYYFWGQFATRIYGYSSYPYVYYNKLVGSPLGDEAMGYTLGGVINEDSGGSETFLIRYLRLNELNQKGYGYPFIKQKVLWLSVGKSFYLPQRLGQVTGQLAYVKSVSGEGLKSAPSFYLVWNKKF